jgi:hypothetical protein
MSNSYNKSIGNSIVILEETKERLTDVIFQIAINGELKEWADEVEIGEHFYFSKELLQSLEDEKINLLISLVENIETVIAKLES